MWFLILCAVALFVVIAFLYAWAWRTHLRDYLEDKAKGYRYAWWRPWFSAVWVVPIGVYGIWRQFTDHPLTMGSGAAIVYISVVFIALPVVLCCLFHMTVKVTENFNPEAPTPPTPEDWPHPLPPADRVVVVPLRTRKGYGTAGLTRIG